MAGGAASPAASSAVRISSGRRTKSNASTFFKPISANRSSESAATAFASERFAAVRAALADQVRGQQDDGRIRSDLDANRWLTPIAPERSEPRGVGLGLDAPADSAEW